ncbi:MAG: TlpA family protein disulfide reductase [Bacteroidales bacterium]|nr:TlpA family protein disulfide reductase [Bacteroidales bacterium]
MAKRTILFMAALATLLTTTAQKTTLRGTLEDCPEGTAVVLNLTSGQTLVPHDTLRLDAKGAYRATLDIDRATFVVLTLTVPRSPMVHAILLPGENVTMNLQYVPQINHIQVVSSRGSENADIYRRFNNMIGEATLNPELRDDLPGQIEELIARNTSCLMSAFIVTIFDQNFDSYAPLYKELRDSLAPRYPDNDFVIHLNDLLRGQIIQGMEAPEISLPDANGIVRNLSELRGHVVLIDFWASWCKPCRMENPNVVRLYKKYYKDGFKIYSVSLDNNRNAWVKAVEDDGLVWPHHVSDLRGWQSAAARTYGINSIPATVLISPEGIVAARNLRGADLEKALHDIYGH